MFGKIIRGSYYYDQISQERKKVKNPHNNAAPIKKYMLMAIVNSLA